MGVYKRDCLREEPVASPGQGGGAVVGGLLGLHGLALLMQWSAPPAIWDWLVMRPSAVLGEGQVWRLLTGIFCFGPQGAPVWAVLWLAYFLWLFGRELAQLYGAANFLFFYLAAGVCAALVWALAATWGPALERGPGWRAFLETSAAVSGVVALFALYFPTRTLTRVGGLAVPVWLGALVFFVVELAVLAPNWLSLPAHAGGVLYALLDFQFDWRWTTLLGRLRRRPAPAGYSPPTIPFRPADGAETERPGGPPVNDNRLESQVDQVLEKISRSGTASLNEEERRILQEASTRYRQRRS